MVMTHDTQLCFVVAFLYCIRAAFFLGAIAVAYSQVHGQFLGTNESTVSLSLSLSQLSVQLPEQQAVPCPLFCSQ